MGGDEIGHALEDQPAPRRGDLCRRADSRHRHGAAIESPAAATFSHCALRMCQPSSAEKHQSHQRGSVMRQPRPEHGVSLRGQVLAEGGRFFDMSSHSKAPPRDARHDAVTLIEHREDVNANDGMARHLHQNMRRSTLRVRCPQVNPLEHNEPDRMADRNLDALAKEADYDFGIPAQGTIRDSSRRRLWGMTGGQRLVLVLMLFLNVAVLGLFFLLASGRIDVPIP